jgi:hypothetical protein
MTFLAPGWIFVGVGGALALVALHLLALGRPAPLVLPTARFVPLRAARARRLARRPTDLLLLAARAGAVLLGALALARPTRTPTRRPVARVIVADRAGVPAVRDSVRALAARGIAGAGDLLVGFDASARTPLALGATAAARDSSIDAALGPDSAPVAAGSLSAALAAARRAAPRLREAADSLELVIVSPLTTAEVDAATAAVRAVWTGRARVVRVATDARAAGADAGAPVRVVWRRGAPEDDALAAAVALESGSRARDRSYPGGLPPLRPGSHDADSTSSSFPRTTAPTQRAPVLVVRDGATAADSALARDSAAVLVDWPADGVPNGWRRRARVDTAGAVAAAAAAFVAPLPRRAEWPTEPRADTRVVARWADGAPAAVERPLGAGCVRAVAVPVPQVGDAALRAPFRALLAELTAPCAHRAAGAPLDAPAARALAGSGPLLATRALGAAPAPTDPLARWLLAGALALLVAELPLRLARRRDVSVDVEEHTPTPDAEAAA